jgi:hypothetical protein
MIVSPIHRPPLPPENILSTHFCKRLSQPQGHSVTGRIMLIKNSNDTIRDRTRDIPAYSTVPQPTALPHAPFMGGYKVKFTFTLAGIETRSIASRYTD